MKLIKKNQLTILVLALMLVTAGYLNYNSSVQTGTEVASIGDATLVSSNLSNSVNTVQNNVNEGTKYNNTVQSSVSKTEKNIVKTNSDVANEAEGYFESSRLERDVMYSQMLEGYQKILNNDNSSEKQKTAAQKEIDNINKTKNRIMICENLIRTKGFNDVVIFVNDDSISVVVNKEELKKEDTAQIQSIIAREMNAKIDNIHISNK